VKITTAIAIGILLAATSGTSQTQNSEKAQQVDGRDLIARGKYIVEGVAVCGQCHTPRNSQGVSERGRGLQGAPLWLQPAKPTGDWPAQAPRIAGIPPGTDEQMVTLLTTGIWRDGKRPRPPMPQFRMTQQDAQAVVAYLKSLNPPAQ
jgi:mono/diheme cytochrome c family protein